ncbi:ABC transporter substrate-binding protein [Microvirga sp. VF16]|uniref:ABC transporter substrate-binding protein n=1 Tax=Microvirga sp. VF16 TaxID=2807101 RepID=UPI00193D7121|nr:ABC transporter substrate-binding protein [Microvirga sp. VF16]QRM32924.1 polyamine ABC transporter substrate-binding protein [Microvirga sp. VF16]
MNKWMNRRTFGCGVLAAGLATTIPTLGRTQELAAEQTLRIGLDINDIATFDPHISVAGEAEIFQQIYEGLVAFKDGTMDVTDLQPGLAERWEASPDKKIWTFTLRKNVKWHDGSDFTSDDVKYSLERVLDPKFGSPFRTAVANIDNVEALPGVVKIALKEPDPNFPQLMVNYHAGNIVSKKAGEAGKIKLSPVGTGPFKFSEYKVRERVSLIGNESYWNGKPIIEQISYLFMSEASTRELALKTGEVHAISLQARQNVVDRVRRFAEVNLTAPANTYYLFINVKKAPFDNIQVRQALAHATDAAGLIKYIGADIAKPERSALPKGYVGHTDDVTQYRYDIAKAKMLLKEAGLANGFSMSVNMSNNEIYLPIMQVLQEQWKKVGISIDLKVVDHPTYHRLIREDANPVVIYGAFRYPLTGRIYLNQFYKGSSAIGKPTAVTNFSHFGDVIPGADDELTKAESSADAAEQIRLWEQAQKKIADAAVSIPLYTQNAAMARSTLIELGHVQRSNFYLITEKTRLLAK